MVDDPVIVVTLLSSKKPREALGTEILDKSIGSSGAVGLTLGCRISYDCAMLADRNAHTLGGAWLGTIDITHDVLIVLRSGNLLCAA